MRMKSTDKKAVRLVLHNRVTLTTTPDFGDDGELLHATGTVEGDTGTYTVVITPAGSTCTCTHGTNHPGRTHSHDQALRLQAQREAEGI